MFKDSVLNFYILTNSKIESALAFMWQSQLRHRWDDDRADCYANICDAEFR